MVGDTDLREVPQPRRAILDGLLELIRSELPGDWRVRWSGVHVGQRGYACITVGHGEQTLGGVRVRLHRDRVELIEQRFWHRIRQWSVPYDDPSLLEQIVELVRTHVSRKPAWWWRWQILRRLFG